MSSQQTITPPPAQAPAPSSTQATPSAGARSAPAASETQEVLDDAAILAWLEEMSADLQRADGGAFLQPEPTPQPLALTAPSQNLGTSAKKRPLRDMIDLTLGPDTSPQPKKRNQSITQGQIDLTLEPDTSPQPTKRSDRTPQEAHLPPMSGLSWVQSVSNTLTALRSAPPEASGPKPVAKPEQRAPTWTHYTPHTSLPPRTVRPATAQSVSSPQPPRAPEIEYSKAITVLQAFHRARLFTANYVSFRDRVPLQPGTARWLIFQGDSNLPESLTPGSVFECSTRNERFVETASPTHINDGRAQGYLSRYECASQVPGQTIVVWKWRSDAHRAVAFLPEAEGQPTPAQARPGGAADTNFPDLFLADNHSVPRP